MSEKDRQSRRSAPLLEIEDLLLAAWLLIAETLVVRYSGRTPVEWVEGPFESGASVSWPQVLFLLAAVFVIFTRGSCDTSIDTAVLRRVWMAPPLYYILPLIALAVSAIRGGEKSITQRGIGGDEAEWPFPAAPDWLRRLVATPIFLVGDSAFLSAFAEEERSLGGLEGDWSFKEIAFSSFLVALPYLIFIIGPRIATGSSTDWKVWIPRFAFYLLALIFGRQLATGWL